MNLALTVLEIVAPVFLLAGIGFSWVRLGFEYRLEFVTRLSMTLAVPSLVFVALMQSDIPGADLMQFALAAIAAHIILALVFWVITRLTGLDQRTYLAPLIFGNTGNVGLPLCLFAFGEAGLGYGVVVLAVTTLFAFTYGIYVVAGQGAFGRVIREPMVWGAILGALFLWQGWETPAVLTNTLSLIGQMAIPLMLITLGVAVARIKPGDLGMSFVLSATKLAVCVSVGWVIATQFGLAHTAFGVLILQLAAPVAVTSYLLAERFKAGSDAVAGLVVASTLLSVVSFPVLLTFLL